MKEKEEFDRFVERMAKIRDLSSPPLYDFDDAGDYSERLKNNFETIGKLAEENRRMLEYVLYPLLKEEVKLSDETVDELTEFSENLLCFAEKETDFENLDLPVMNMVSEKLVQNAEESGSTEKLISCMDAATDSVGRSYNKGKTVDDYLKEVREGSGTRYAPWLAGLLEDEKVKRDLEDILTVGRETTYRDTYTLLKKVKENVN